MAVRTLQVSNQQIMAQHTTQLAATQNSLNNLTSAIEKLTSEVSALKDVASAPPSIDSASLQTALSSVVAQVSSVVAPIIPALVPLQRICSFLPGNVQQVSPTAQGGEVIVNEIGSGGGQSAERPRERPLIINEGGSAGGSAGAGPSRRDSREYTDKMKGIAETPEQTDDIPIQGQQVFVDVDKILPSANKEQIKLKKAIIESAEESEMNITVAPRSSYSPLDTNLHQLDLPLAPRAYGYPNHYLAGNATAGANRNRLMRIFISTYSQNPDDLWTLVKIQKLESVRIEETTKKEKFVSFLIQRFNGKRERISSADFPFMNPNDIFVLSKLLNSITLEDDRETYRNLVSTGFYVVNEFVKHYIRDLAKVEYESAQIARNTGSVFVPNRSVPEDLQNVVGGTIIEAPEFGVIVEYKLTNGPMVKILMRFDELQGYPNKFLDLMVREMLLVRSNDRDHVEEIKEKVDWLKKFRVALNEMRPLFSN
jgi:hypothetical protein